MSESNALGERFMTLGKQLHELLERSLSPPGTDGQSDVLSGILRELERSALGAAMKDSYARNLLALGDGGEMDDTTPARLRAIATLFFTGLTSSPPTVGDLALIMAHADGHSESSKVLAARRVVGDLIANVGCVVAISRTCDRVQLSDGLISHFAGELGYLSQQQLNNATAKHQSRAIGSPQEPRSIPSLAFLTTQIHQHFVGQDEAVRSISIQLMLHASRLRMLDKNETPPPGGLVVVAGCSGSGKSSLLSAATSVCRLPASCTCANSITTEGYVGLSIDAIYTPIIQQIRNNGRDTYEGVTVLDEFDSRISTKDVLDFQSELLVLVQGNPPSRQIGGKRPNDIQPIHIDVRRFMLIASGVFAGLNKSLAKRSGEAIGFGGRVENTRHMIDGLQDCGMASSLSNRVRCLIILPTPTYADVIRICTAPHGVVASQNRLLREIDPELQLRFEADALRYMVEVSCEEKSYTRGVQRLVSAVSDWAICTGKIKYSLSDIKEIVARTESAIALASPGTGPGCEMSHCMVK